VKEGKSRLFREEMAAPTMRLFPRRPLIPVMPSLLALTTPRRASKTVDRSMVSVVLIIRLKDRKGIKMLLRLDTPMKQKPLLKGTTSKHSR
jgi:hypothetical protein